MRLTGRSWLTAFAMLAVAGCAQPIEIPFDDNSKAAPDSSVDPSGQLDGGSGQGRDGTAADFGYYADTVVPSPTHDGGLGDATTDATPDGGAADATGNDGATDDGAAADGGVDASGADDASTDDGGDDA